ncbi:MAG: hypothetical protein M3Y72_22590 [Acidobacteriota bacterium]|nr:hypothetical protein [Acidobacteriota bacterium]MDQ2843775.1 hypothetical protein [Acidobacteriota bacterium]
MGINDRAMERYLAKLRGIDVSQWPPEKEEGAKETRYLRMVAPELHWTAANLAACSYQRKVDCVGPLAI